MKMHQTLLLTMYRSHNMLERSPPDTAQETSKSIFAFFADSKNGKNDETNHDYFTNGV